jgi:hypothetical protein
MLRFDRPTMHAAALALAVLTAAGCTFAAPTAAPGDNATPTSPGAASASPATTALDPVFAGWRRAPVHPSPQLVEAASAACRDQPAVGSKPLVVSDARGEGLLTLVFADADHAAVCHATVTESGIATADARALTGAASPAPGATKLGIHDLELVESSAGARNVLVGRVGSDVARVAAQFDDATWSNASMAGGWYAIWWPGGQPVLTVAAVDSRSGALDAFAP